MKKMNLSRKAKKFFEKSAREFLKSGRDIDFPFRSSKATEARFDWVDGFIDGTWAVFIHEVHNGTQWKRFNQIKKQVPKEEAVLYAMAFHIAQLMIEYERGHTVTEFGDTILCRVGQLCSKCPASGKVCGSSRNTIKRCLKKYSKMFFEYWAKKSVLPTDLSLKAKKKIHKMAEEVRKSGKGIMNYSADLD